MEQLVNSTQSPGQDARPSLDLQKVGAGRYFFAAILGALFSLLVFSLLATLTKPGDVSLQQRLPSAELDFLLVRNESDLELRQRRRPPEPEEPASMESFVAKPMQPVQNLNVDAAQLQFDVPDINVGLAVDLSPALSDLSQNALNTQMYAVDIPLQQNLKALKDVPPRYPSRAQRKKIEGQLLAGVSGR